MERIDLVDLAEAAAEGGAANDGAEAPKKKSDRALRTISEAADALDVPQHVLRFWETKFPQIKPLKRNGGRRFYRPEDIETLQQIKTLLYKQGFTIKGARKALETGVTEAPAEETASTATEAEQPAVIGGRSASELEDKKAELQRMKEMLVGCKKALAPFVSNK